MKLAGLFFAVLACLWSYGAMEMMDQGNLTATLWCVGATVFFGGMAKILLTDKRKEGNGL